MRLTRQQLTDLEAAADHAGLSVSGYTAEAAVAAATDAQPPLSQPLRKALADLLDARSQLRLLGTNVHLAIGAYHRNGVPPSWLQAAVQDASRAVSRVDEAATAITRALR